VTFGGPDERAHTPLHSFGDIGHGALPSVAGRIPNPHAHLPVRQRRILVMTIAIKAFAHVRLTVTDIGRSRAFYDSLFGLPVAIEMPPDADETSRDRFAFLYGGVIYQLGDSAFGLRSAVCDRAEPRRDRCR
jgi:hypothetical protein